MSIQFTRYVFGTQTTNTETDIPYSVNVPGEIYGGSYVVAALQELEAWAFDAECNCPQYPNSQTTPPLPPVYPILFASDLVYGREHFSNNLKMFRGDKYQRTMAVIQNGRYFDLTDYTIRMTFKWSFDDADADAVFVLSSPSDGITITSATTGEFQFTIYPADTINLPSHTVSLIYDAQITDNNDSNNVYTVSYGRLLVLPDSSVTVP